MLKGIAAVVALAGALWAGQANATLVTVTYGGFATGQDKLGLFGAAGTVYTNTPFVSQYQFDELDDYFATVGSFLGADLTINGRNLSIPGNQHAVFGTDATLDGLLRMSELKGYNVIVPAAIEHPFVVLANAIWTDAPAGRTEAFSGDGASASVVYSNFFSLGYRDTAVARMDSMGFYLDTRSVQVVSVAGVPSGGRGVGFRALPEPATWAMLMLGFFGVGAAIRGRRSGPAMA